MKVLDEPCADCGKATAGIWLGYAVALCDACYHVRKGSA